MSVEAMAYVVQLRRCPDGAPISRGQKCVLLVLSNYHNPAFKVAWPSLPLLAEDSQSSIAQVKRDLDYFEKHGVLRRMKSIGGRGKTTDYAFIEVDGGPQKPAHGEPVSGDKPAHGEPVSDGKTSSKPAHPNGQTSSKPAHPDMRNKEITGSRERTGNRESAAAYADARHSLVKLAITRLQKHDLGFEMWDEPEDDRKLQQLLSRKQDISGERLVDCVVNRWLSPASTSDPVRKWIVKLLEYAGGPKNSFNDLVRFEVEQFRRLRAIATASEDPQQSIQVEHVSVAPAATVIELEIPSPNGGTWNGSTPADVWHRVQMRLESMLSRLTYDVWIKPTRGVEYLDGTLVVSIPTAEFAEVRDRFAEEIVRAVREIRVPCKRLHFRTGYVRVTGGAQ
jgi:hypothetical protein